MLFGFVNSYELLDVPLFRLLYLICPDQFATHFLFYTQPIYRYPLSDTIYQLHVYQIIESTSPDKSLDIITSPTVKTAVTSGYIQFLLINFYYKTT